MGLTAAVALKQAGVDVAIVDRDIMNRNGARAAIVHARTLEVCEPPVFLLFGWCSMPCLPGP